MLEKMKPMFLWAFLLFALTLSSQGFAQTKSKTATQIEEVYGVAAKQFSSEQLLWLQNQLERSSIKKMDANTNVATLPILSKQPLVDKFKPGIKQDDFSKPLSINPLKYRIDFYNPADQTFSIDGTDYVLFIAGHKEKHN